MFATATRKPPGLDIDSILQALGQPQPGMTPPYVAQGNGPTGMVKNADGTSSFPSTFSAPRFNAPGAPGMFAAGRPPMIAEREPLNFGAPMPDDILGTKPIGTPGIGDGVIPSDPRIAKAMQPKFFGKGGKGWTIMGILGDAMAAAGGGQPTYLPAMQERQKRELEQQRWLAEQKVAQAKFDWERRKDMRPDVKVLGRTAISIPFEGDPSVLYQAPSDAEQYASTLGLSEGDEGYADAVMDYTLRSNGPTAYEQRRQLEDQRFGNRVSLRGVPTYANLHPLTSGRGGGNSGGPKPPRNTGNVYAPILEKLSKGIPLTAGEQQVLSYYGRGRGRGKDPAPFNPAPTAPRLPSAQPRPSAPRAPVRQSGPVRVSTPAEARKLKPGTVFITPDGQQKVR
jgi:hypothetical protein